MGKSLREQIEDLRKRLDSKLIEDLSKVIDNDKVEQYGSYVGIRLSDMEDNWDPRYHVFKHTLKLLSKHVGKNGAESTLKVLEALEDGNTITLNSKRIKIHPNLKSQLLKILYKY